MLLRIISNETLKKGSKVLSFIYTWEALVTEQSKTINQLMKKYCFKDYRYLESLEIPIPLAKIIFMLFKDLIKNY
jgi:hypothetical protein